MNHRIGRLGISVIAAICSFAPLGITQDASTTTSIAAANANTPVVPQLVNYSGVLTDVNGKPLTNTVGVTFTLYRESTGGTPLWTEIQNVLPSKSGRYSVTLGSTTSTGLPADVFVNGEARWLGVQIEGQAEQPRILLVAVPYALKAGDAETIGGLPASAFVLVNGAQTSSVSTKSSSAATPLANAKNSAPANPAVTGTGVANYIPVWDSASDIIDSLMFQSASKIGVGTTTPAALLDVNGKTAVRDTLTLFPKNTDSTLTVNGTAFKVDSTGKVTFIAGQTFPGTGTITGITTAAGSGLAGGGTSGTLSLTVPAAGITNTMLVDSKIILSPSTGGGVTAPGAMSLGGTYTIGLKTCSANQVLKYSGTAWACASAATGTVSSVGSGAGLTGGPITGTGSLSIASAGVTNTMLQNSSITLNAGSGLTGPGAMSLGNTYTLGLTTTCAVNQILKWNGSAWACSADSNSGGTVTSVGNGAGLTGGPITGSGSLSIASAGVTNTMLQNSSITLNAGSGLTGPGAMSLGNTYTLGLTTSCSANQILKWNGSAWACSTDTNSGGTVTSVGTGLGLSGGPITDSGTLAINTAVVPQLAAANIFSNTQTISANSGSSTLTLENAGGGDGMAILGSAPDGIYVENAEYGIDAFASSYGGFFNGQIAGLLGENDIDVPLDFAVSGVEFGSTTATIGVYGYSASTVGVGVTGIANSQSSASSIVVGSYPIGVWGDSGVPEGFGVFGAADDGWSFVGYNNSPTGFANTWLENQETNDAYSPVLYVYGSGFDGTCTTDVSGNLSCTGAVSGVANVQGGAKKVALNSIQSPENWFEDAGSGQLSSGAATVNIESVFGETVNTGIEYHVFLTPNGDCKGLYVAQKSATSFEVRELGGGTSSVAFDYRIMAKRKGFEQVRLLDKTELFSLKHRPIKPADAPAQRMPSAQERRQEMQQHHKHRPTARLAAAPLNK